MLFYLRNRVVIVASVATTKADLGLEKHQNMDNGGKKASKYGNGDKTLQELRMLSPVTLYWRVILNVQSAVLNCQKRNQVSRIAP